MGRWSLALCALAVGLGGCGEQAKFNNRCQKITFTRCQREEACFGQTDYVLCEMNHESMWSCDPDAPLEDLEECARQLDPTTGLPCENASLMPEICYEVLCSTLLGCDFTTTQGSGTSE
jgi:hypothetical protein